MNLIEIVEQLESCNYECEAGALVNNTHFIELKRIASAGQFCFAQDDDSHWYLIPAVKKAEFDAWLEHQMKLWNSPASDYLTDEEFEQLESEYSGEDFESCRINTAPDLYAFENPMSL